MIPPTPRSSNTLPLNQSMTAVLNADHRWFLMPSTTAAPSLPSHAPGPLATSFDQLGPGAERLHDGLRRLDRALHDRVRGVDGGVDALFEQGQRLVERGAEQIERFLHRLLEAVGDLVDGGDRLVDGLSDGVLELCLERRERREQDATDRGQRLADALDRRDDHLAREIDRRHGQLLGGVDHRLDRVLASVPDYVNNGRIGRAA